MTEAENIREVERLLPSWMGFICWKNSPRGVEVPPAYLPEQPQRTGVFVNPTMEYVLQKTEEFRFDHVQLHGKESADFCRDLRKALLRIPRPVSLIKAFAVASPADLNCVAEYTAHCDYFLFDTKCTCTGGSGRAFDWQILQHYTGPIPFILSGGIGPDSLPALRQFSHPYWTGIDLNSRFEDTPGHKNIALLQSFFRELKNHSLL